MGWQEYRLDHLCDIARGGSPRPIKKYLTDDPNGVNWIKISDASASGKYIKRTKQKITVDGVSRSRLVEPGDFLLSNSMSFGRPYIMKTSGCIHDGWLVLKDKCGLFDQDYLYHFLGSPAAFQQFDNRAVGSTVRNLNIGLVSSVKAPIPPLPEQKRIVAILDEAFASIDQAKANTERNLTNARELFDSYLNRVFELAWSTSKRGVMADLATDITDGDHSAPPKSDEGIPFITISNINKQTRKIDFGDTFKVPTSYYEALKENRKPRENDVLYTVTGSFGIPVMVDFVKMFCFQRHIGLIRPKADVDSKWLYYLCMSPRIFSQASDRATGTAQKTVSLKALRSLEVPIVDHQQQIALVPDLEQVDSQTFSLVNEMTKKIDWLDELKQSILKKAFAGELTSNPDKVLNEVGV